MKITLPQALTLATLLSATVFGGSALAETYVKGTQVSYEKDIDSSSKTNYSSVYIDEANDTEGENYVEFYCEDGAAIFYMYSNQELYDQAQFDDETTPPLTVTVDSNKPLKMNTLSLTDENDEPDFYGLAVEDKFDAQMLRLFQTAKTKVVLSVTRFDKKTLNFTFYTKGFNDGFKAVNECK